MNDNVRKICTAAMAFALLAAGCSTKETSSSADTPTESASVPNKSERNETKPQAQNIPTALLTAASPVCISDISSVFSDRDLSGSYDAPTAEITCSGNSAAVTGSGVTVSGSDITITDEGVYRITGKLDDGQILVNSPGKVQLVLDGVSLSCSDSAPIYVQQAKKCFLTLAEGSVNYVSDGNSYVYASDGDNEPDAAIFSADSLTVNGSGKLTVNGNYNEGITCKDDIIITGGTLLISSVGNGIKGKDYVAIAGGDITVNAGGDGIKSTNTEDAGCGFVYVQNGTITVDAQEDGIQAETEFIAAGGTFHVTSGGGSANAEPKQNQDFGGRGGFGGFGNWGNYDETETTEDTSVSIKGIKAGTLLYISNGELTVDAADDGLHSNADLCICGGKTEIKAGSDGIHADGLADFTDGTVHIAKSNEGIEAAGIRVSGSASLDVTASDDGFNASDGTTQGGMGTYSDGCAVEISGGTVYVNAGGDGLDSNGDLLVSGGAVIVDGPSNSGNGALDSNGSIYCTGGLLVAAGSSGMAEYPMGSQNTAVITLDSTQQNGTTVKIVDSSGKEIVSHTPVKQFNSVIVSSSDLKSGETYTVFTNDTEHASFTVEDTISYIGTAGGMNGGFHGGGRGDKFHDMQMPTDENGNPSMPEGMQPPQGGFRGDRFQDMQMPTDENGNPSMPEGMHPPQGGFRGDRFQDMQMPTDENGNPSMPEGMQPPQGGFREEVRDYQVQ